MGLKGIISAGDITAKTITVKCDDEISGITMGDKVVVLDKDTYSKLLGSATLLGCPAKTSFTNDDVLDFLIEKFKFRDYGCYFTEMSCAYRGYALRIEAQNRGLMYKKEDYYYLTELGKSALKEFSTPEIE